jgi:acetyl-CoA carboxylase/biotin carboxylase 1
LRGVLRRRSFDAACITSEDEAVEAAGKIGYPVMLKASEGGGGKGIRMADDEAALRAAWPQVLNEVGKEGSQARSVERWWLRAPFTADLALVPCAMTCQVPGSPVFLVTLCTGARHIEVQVMGDGVNAIALGGRDCSTQRRFQKIFEEGPPIVVPNDVFIDMMKAAVSLCKSLGYESAGTIEYLYIPATKQCASTPSILRRREAQLFPRLRLPTRERECTVASGAGTTSSS